MKREYTCQGCGQIGDMNIDGGECENCGTVNKEETR
jgi:rRNA maturation endonuclease Nob1